MMIKHYLTLIAFLTLHNAVSAQEIKGVVRDSTGSSISHATIMLFSLPDTVQINYTITDLEGRFNMKPINESDYLLYVSIIGYKSQYVRANDFQIITMEQEMTSIDGVVVRGFRPISKITANGVQTIVANTVLSDMGSGNDVLKRIPMVTGNNGNFGVFGRGKAKIYINNREVRDPSEIDNLNSKDIQSVEVISSPGARFDATAVAVIHIKTIKQQGDGFSFNLRSSFYTWENQDYINQINTNYRRKRLDIFANAYYSNTTTIQKGNVSQITTIDTLWKQNSYIDTKLYRNNLNGTLGANFQADDNNIFGFRYDIKTTPFVNLGSTYFTSNVYANNMLFDKWNNNEITKKENRANSQVSLYYAGKIKKTSIDFNVDYMNSGSISHNTNIEKSELEGDRVLHSTSNIDNELLAAKLQLSHPIFNGELLIGTEYVNIERLDKYINNELTHYSSKVGISEQNFALFSQYQKQTKIGNFSVGVRYENAAYDYFVDDIITNDKNRKYGQLFPSASYSNRFGEINVQLTYDSKVVRPSYEQLSNNIIYGNKFTIQTGNPYLKPSIIHTGSLIGIFKFIQAQVSYTHQKDAIVLWIDRYEKDPKISLINYRNIAELPKLSAFISIEPKFGIWRPRLSGGVQRFWQNYREYGIDLDMNEPQFYVALSNTFDLPHNFLVNIDAAYISKGYGPTIYSYKDALSLDFDISKYFINKTLQVKLGVSDITNVSSANLTIMPQTELKNIYYFGNRKVWLTFRYYFNSTNSRYKGVGAGRDAINRL